MGDVRKAIRSLCNNQPIRTRQSLRGIETQESKRWNFVNKDFQSRDTRDDSVLVDFDGSALGKCLGDGSSKQTRQTVEAPEDWG